jgi:hypothetical protein
LGKNELGRDKTMALSGYSKESGHVVVKQIFDSSDRNIDAETLQASDLIKLFEPNEGSDDEQICSYDRMTSATGPYYLVAERGVGKTHALGLLGVILNKRGDTVLKIELIENQILSTYEKLKRELPRRESRIGIWQIAILEEASIALVDKYIRYANSFEFRDLPLPIKQGFEKDFKNGQVKFYNYLKKYRKEDWGKYHPAEKNAQELFNKTVEVIGKIISKIQIQISPIRLGIAAIPETSLAPAAANLKPTVKEAEISILSARMLEIEDWFWNMLGLMRQFRHQPVPELSARLTRHLPKVHSIYILADGLDQTMKPMSHNDLLALKFAARYLNRKSIKKLNEGAENNFKLIVSFRAVTFNYYIKPKDTDKEQVYSDIETLAWNSMALRHMMARRIRDADDSLSPNMTVDEVIQTRFPREIHYFGRIFSPAPEFFFRFAGYRPRQVILLWHSCAEKAGGKDHPYNIILNEDQIIEGFREYSIGILPEDISEEYVAEYGGLKDMLNYFAIHREDISRELSHDSLTMLLNSFVEEYKRHNKRQEPKWMQSGVDEMIDTLYDIGLIAIPTERRDTDWPKLRHVYEEPFIKASTFPILFIRPPMWNFITNIQNETRLRRIYIKNLYSKLKESMVSLTNMLDTKESRSNLSFELEICHFLVLGKLIRDYVRYPEPIDWRIWNDTCQAIDRTWGALGQLAAWQIIDGNSVVSNIDGIADRVTPFIIREHTESPFKLQLNSQSELEVAKSNEEYLKAISPLTPWLDLYKSTSQPQATQNFYASLLIGSQSLNPVLGAAISAITPLI